MLMPLQSETDWTHGKDFDLLVHLCWFDWVPQLLGFVYYAYARLDVNASGVTTAPSAKSLVEIATVGLLSIPSVCSVAAC
jgi:hypothetical protein